MRKFLTLYITPLFSITIILLRIPDIERLLKSSQISFLTPIGIGVMLALLTVLAHIITVISPYKQYEKLATNKWAILDFTIEDFKERYSQYQLSVNIMKPKLSFFYRIEPKKDNKKKKFSLYGYVFKVLWLDTNSNIHKKLKITTNQGVCGNAYSNGIGIVAAEFVSGRTHNFNFSDEQIQLTRDLKMVTSCPILDTENTPHAQKRRIIAVFNVESKVTGSEALVLNDADKIKFDEELVRLSDLISKLIV